ncbi:hypothetical protein L336_0820 [Candidatus Saccharimonas aalborgensis]|uniref:Uncharacterized protein n=1 Tax=Candidatus Saccharimonas aalborgensis TaxID=1332188 RepID=R4PXN3_9BACT|nr:hypothetical protein [Candidatus Saccharimonas aalborgensis]AGL62522.1 hypothetical protein L336_0820 [Candidatus Saccharimonas aalborgensis]QQR51282.1 MAG: hypothetical protein IPF89_00340 [Candidatus Saccharibacteria bacterium]QQS68023.1 MAG: hypothetical protein IPP24_03320 [Candidatus Saccharibacteria bacterium]QQS70366.1 MAG: hypothetical protein IPP92_03460 [Candidatus Saccharibacteria bacterium]
MMYNDLRKTHIAVLTSEAEAARLDLATHRHLLGELLAAYAELVRESGQAHSSEWANLFNAYAWGDLDFSALYAMLNIQETRPTNEPRTETNTVRNACVIYQHRALVNPPRQ